jgi:hypothetical protein
VWWNLALIAGIAALAALVFVFLDHVLEWRFFRALTVTVCLALPPVWGALRARARPLDWARANVWQWAPATALLAGAAVYALLLHWPLPYFDHWDLILLSEKRAAHALTFADLFAQHGTHWHATGYMVMLTTAQLTHMAHWAEITASVCFAGLAAVALRHVLAATLRETKKKPALLAPAFGIGALFLLSLDQAENWLWGWQVAVFVNIAGALTALWLLTAPRLTPGRLLGALVAAAAAIYAFATGLALLPVGLAVIALRRDGGLRWPAFAVWLVFSLAVGWHYKTGVLDTAKQYVESITPARLDGATFAALLGYVTDLIGGAVGRFSDGLPIAMAVIGVGLLAGTLPLAMRGGRFRALIPALGLAAYGFGAACLIAYGRLGFEHAFGSRYITFANLFWIGVLAIAILGQENAERKLTKRVIVGTLALILVSKVGNIGNVATNRFAAPQHARLEQVAAEFCAAYPAIPPALVAEVSSPTQSNVVERVDFIAREKLSFFRKCATRPPAP